VLISISGSQGCGKTTTLNLLKQYGHTIVERKTSRSILSDWNVSLDQVNRDFDLTLKFQDEILARKIADEQEFVNTKEIVFTERSYADLFTYGLIVLGKHNQYSDWVDEYYQRCKQAQQTYGCVVFLKGGLFPIEHDGTRGSNQHYQKMVDQTILMNVMSMTDSKKHTTIETADITKRVQAIEQIILNIKIFGEL
jgi:predicted ATPase